MKFARTAVKAVWHSAGDVMTDAGKMEIAAATAWFDELCQLTVDAVYRGDMDAIGYCSSTGFAVMQAICAADDFRCAAAGMPRRRSPLAHWRERVGNP